MENIKLKKIVESIALSEAKFNKSKVKKVSELIASILGKELGGDFKMLGAGFGEESFKKKGYGQGKGFKFINKSGYMIRFGWLEKSKSDYEINVVDVWNPNSGATWDTPSMTIYLAEWMNIVDVVSELKDIIVHGSASVVESANENKENLFESAPRKMISYALAKGVEYNGESEHKLLKKLKDEGVFDPDEYRGWKVEKGQKEVNSTISLIKDAETKLKKQKYADPEIVFDDIEKLTKTVAMGLQNSLIVAGMAGIGKTYHVEKTLKDLFGSPEGADAKWRYRQGAKLSPMGLYQDLFANKDDLVIVYDDSDSVWSDKDAINMLKSALDTKKTRILTWISPRTQNVDLLSPEEKDEYYEKLYTAMREKPEDVGTKIKLPSTFTFTSRVIFISNLKASKFEQGDMAAIASRSLFMDINLSREGVIQRMYSILPFVSPEISMDEKKQVVEQLSEGGKELSMRAVLAGIAVKSAGFDDWDRLAASYAGR